MKNLNICIDIDGTITDPYYWLDSCNEYFNTTITKEDVTEYSISNVLGVKEEEYIEFYKKNKLKIHWNQAIIPEAIKYIKLLNFKNNIYFVTARDKNLIMLTHSYLRKHSISYDGLFLLGSHHKVNKAKDLNCDIFIDDSYNNAIELSNAGFKVLLIDTNYNRKDLNENIIRVNNWREIYEEINKLSIEINCG